MSESMMVRGSDRIAANTAIPLASPIGDYYTQPAVFSQAAPEIAKMPPTIMFSISQNTVLLLAAGCLVLLGVFIGVFLLSGHREHRER